MLIRCPECGKEISDQSDKCIHCGFPLNKLNKEETHEVKKKVTIAIRSGPGSILGATIFIMVFGVLTTTGVTIADIYWLPDPYYAGLAYLLLIFGFFGLYCIVASILTFVRIGKNSRVYADNIVYDPNTHKLILATINGRIVEIDPEQYVSLKDNMFTDNLLYFTYRDVSGKLIKLNLGYCANRDSIRMMLAKVMNKK